MTSGGPSSGSVQPKISVITPSYNTGAFIEETIRSVASQSYTRFEHIVLDSGSTDETPAILDRHPHLHVVAPGPPTMAAKVNAGFELARGEIISWINADDYFLPGAFEAVVAAFDAHPEVGLVYANWLEVDEHSVEVKREKSAQCGHHELVNERNWIPHQTAFFRRSVLDEVGGLDERLTHVLDWELWIRMSRVAPILYVDDEWAAFRVHSQQSSSVGRWQIWPEMSRVARSYGGARFSPLVRRFYRAKALGALRLLRQGQVRGFAHKLKGNLLAR